MKILKFELLASVICLAFMVFAPLFIPKMLSVALPFGVAYVAWILGRLSVICSMKEHRVVLQGVFGDPVSGHSQQLVLQKQSSPKEGTGPKVLVYFPEG